MKTTILNLHGSPYDNGYKSGQFFKNNTEINLEAVKNIVEHDDTKRKMIEANWQKLKKEYFQFYQETIGKADGLGVDRFIYFASLCPEILNYINDSCSTIVCKKANGKYILSHNEDDIYIAGNFCLSKVWDDDRQWFVTNDMFNMPFGNGVSWNSYGIVKTINYCHEENINLQYFPRYFSQRLISSANSIEDMISRCKGMKIASGYHVNVIDINKNTAASIEVHNDNVDVEFINDEYVHTNHYIHGKYSEHQIADNGSNSIFRLNEARKQLKNLKSRDLFGIKNILSYRSKEDVFSNSILQLKKDPNETLFNFCYDCSATDNIYLNVYVNGEELSLKYDQDL